MRRPGGDREGFTVLELLFAVGIAGTLAAMAVPHSLRMLDDFHTRSAARFIAHRLANARFDAIRRASIHGLRFDAVDSDYRLTMVADGNHNGLRMTELQRGVDLTLSEGERLEAHFAGVSFGIHEGIPDADGAPAGSTDGVRTGVSKLLSLNPDGSASSGTLYVRGRGRSQYAVRVLGSTGRVRLLKFDLGKGRWIDVL